MIAIADVLGKSVAVYSNINAAQYRCDVSRLTAGIYYTQVKSDGKTDVLKLVKE